MRVIPSPAHQAGMEGDGSAWTVGLESDRRQNRLAAAAYGESDGKPICWTVGLQRSAAHEHWLYALCVIAFRALTVGGSNRSYSKRKVIELAGGGPQPERWRGKVSAGRFSKRT